MRRALIAAVASVSLGLGMVGLAAPAMAAEPVPATDFGLHIPDISTGTDPTTSYGSIRLWDAGVAWGQVNQAKGKFWWNGLDAAIGNANKQGAQILYVLGSTPTWSATNKKQGSYPNKGAASMPKMADWKAWVSAVVQRYGASIESYQIWNEANLSTFWQGTPKQMAQLTKEAYKIIKAGDPTAKVVAASSTVRLTSAYNKFFPAYLKELKKAGWPVDVYSVHTYPAGPGTPATRAQLISTVQASLKKAGAPAKPLWDTEVNYGIAGPGGGNPHVSIDGLQAANWVADTYLDNQRLGVDRSYWYFWAPADPLLGIQMVDGTAGATGFQTVQNWLKDSYASCATGSVNVCNLTGRFPAVVAWASSGSAAYTVPDFATTMCDALNSCTPVAPGSAITIGDGPKWFGTVTS
jgi:polysaccharide biosynthesis protein PslG